MIRRFRIVIKTRPTEQTGFIARILGPPAKTFLGYCFGRYCYPCSGDSPCQPPFWLTSPFCSFFSNHTSRVPGTEKSLSHLWLCSPITLSLRHRSPLSSGREKCWEGTERKEYFKLLIRKELNLSGKPFLLFLQTYCQEHLKVRL